MPLSTLDDPEHWRGRAEEARTVAEQLSDAESKRTILRIANDYERMAEHENIRGSGGPPAPLSDTLCVHWSRLLCRTDGLMTTGRDLTQRTVCSARHAQAIHIPKTDGLP
jgi:hypothetical protein